MLCVGALAACGNHACGVWKHGCWGAALVATKYAYLGYGTINAQCIAQASTGCQESIDVLAYVQQAGRGCRLELGLELVRRAGVKLQHLSGRDIQQLRHIHMHVSMMKKLYSSEGVRMPNQSHSLLLTITVTLCN